MTESKPGSKLALWLLIAATAVWGSTFIVVQDGIRQMPMMMFMAWRFVIAVAVLVAIRPQALRMSRDTFNKGFFIGLALGFGYWTQTYGLLFTSATVSGFITGLFVILTPLAALIVYKQKIPSIGWFGVFLAAAGVATISLKGWSFGIGESWTFVGAVFFSFQIMWLSRWATPSTSYSIAVVQIGTTAVMFVIGGLLIDGFSVPQTSQVWIAVIFLAVFASALAFVIQTWSQSHLNPTRAAVILSFEPVFAGIFGVLVAGDELTIRILIGGFCIVAAMFIVELGPKHPREAESDLAQPHQGV
ncbi:MAG: hypothetical protein RIS75_613 [Actinomycetota bacterium]|jgi:drug/metabolite transporter (DMT)-like permease